MGNAAIDSSADGFLSEIDRAIANDIIFAAEAFRIASENHQFSPHELNEAGRRVVGAIFEAGSPDLLPVAQNWRVEVYAVERLRDAGLLATPEGRDIAVEMILPPSFGREYGADFFVALRRIFEDDISNGREEEAVTLARNIAERDNNPAAEDFLDRVRKDAEIQKAEAASSKLGAVDRFVLGQVVQLIAENDGSVTHDAVLATFPPDGERRAYEIGALNWLVDMGILTLEHDEVDMSELGNNVYKVDRAKGEPLNWPVGAQTEGPTA